MVENSFWCGIFEMILYITPFIIYLNFVVVGTVCIWVIVLCIS
nr:MAG TPA: Protein of unknown function (DUF2992) [Bacteriophage sp.]